MDIKLDITEGRVSKTYNLAQQIAEDYKVPTGMILNFIKRYGFQAIRLTYEECKLANKPVSLFIYKIKNTKLK